MSIACSSKALELSSRILAVFFQVTRGHLGVAENAAALEAPALNFPGPVHPGLDGFRILSRSLPGQIAIFHSRDFYVESIWSMRGPEILER